MSAPVPSREFRLAAACCRWPDSDARRTAVSALAERDVDWPRLLRIAVRHRIEGLVLDGLVRSRCAIPQPVRAELKQRAEAIAERNLRSAAEALRLQSLLQGAGIRPIFLKGVTLAMLAYGTLSVKDGRDIDILVAPDELGPAGVLLAGAGYRPALPCTGPDHPLSARYAAIKKDIAWIDDRSGLAVELHSRLTDMAAFLPSVGRDSPLRPVACGGGRLDTLADDQLVAYLTVHGGSHCWMRLKWLADLSALLGERDEAEIARLYRDMRALRAGRCPDLALLLCHRLLDFPVPQHLLRLIEADRPTRWLAAIAMRSMIGGADEAEFIERPLIVRLATLSRPLLARSRGDMASLARGWFRSVHDLTDVPLPHALGFLYPVMRVPRALWRLLIALRGTRHGKRALP